MPLIMPVHLICNTSDEQIFENIRENSRLSKVWIKSEEPHDGVAVLCGSGPSLADTIEEIREHQEQGNKVFAMNGAASFLSSFGILPDYQCMIDARKETADLIGPAKEHLFASQVHPECFKRVPDARLWHLQIGNIESVFPDYAGPYALIGGAASVGNTALCLAYVLGFREIHCYGYDSCHREGNGHAFHQAMNDGDPCAVVEFGGKTYTASLTMKLQAEKFMDTSRALKAAGVTLYVHGSGLLPDIYNSPERDKPEDLETAEREKYEQMWANPGYRICAPGEAHVTAAIADLGMKAGDSVLDFGCGTGRGAAEFQKRGFAVIGIDFAENCLDPQVDVPFIKACLWDLPDVTAKWGYCTDVMEHIPTEKVDAVLAGIAARVEACYFNISTQPDVMGALIGEPLHLTVESGAWWKERLTKHWPNVEVRESPGEVVCVCRKERVAPLNTSPEVMVSQAAENLKRGLPTFIEIGPNNGSALIVGGGPSLADNLHRLRFRRNYGGVVFALNGAHDWLIERGIMPDFHVLLDARESVADFVRKPNKRCTYVVAAQCHPAVYEALEGYDIVQWLAWCPGMDELVQQHEDKPICLIGGGETVGLKTVLLAHLWGFRNIHLFGFDSSYAVGQHHAYPQAVNDDDRHIEIEEGGKRFVCATWMVRQADQFLELHKQMTERGVKLTVHGEGLLPTIARNLQPETA